MQKKTSSLLILSISLFFLVNLSGCSEYWWTRGQPPSTNEVLVRAHERFKESKLNAKDSRPELVKLLDKLDLSIGETPDAIDYTSVFTEIESCFLKLEGKLSYGSRPPLMELSGQLRVLTKNKPANSTEIGVSNPAADSAKRLFLARTLFFLANELKVPAPDPIKTS